MYTSASIGLKKFVPPVVSATHAETTITFTESHVPPRSSSPREDIDPFAVNVSR
jgi:hypothetical protein